MTSLFYEFSWGLLEMVKKTQRRRGGGYQTSQQFFQPDVLPSSTFFPGVPTTAVTPSEIRPVLMQTGARRYKGGFSPSVMGSFVSNAQAAIVPAALYLVYHTLVPKTSLRKGGRYTRKNARK